MSESLSPEVHVESEHDKIVHDVEIALGIIKSSDVTRDQALGIVRKLLQPVSENSF